MIFCKTKNLPSTDGRFLDISILTETHSIGETGLLKGVP